MAHLDQVLFSVFQQYIDMPFLIDTGDHADGAIHPTSFPVILDEDDLGLFLNGQFQLGRQGRFWKFSLDFPV